MTGHHAGIRGREPPPLSGRALKNASQFARLRRAPRVPGPAPLPDLAPEGEETPMWTTAPAIDAGRMCRRLRRAIAERRLHRDGLLVAQQLLLWKLPHRLDVAATYAALIRELRI